MQNSEICSSSQKISFSSTEGKVRWPEEEKTSAKNPLKFAISQKIMAPFVDGNRYPGEVTKIQEHNRTYTVKVWIKTNMDYKNHYEIIFDIFQ